MDTREWLKAGTILSFPGMQCRIRSFVGRGSNSLVYLGEYEDQSSVGQYHDVIVKELFPLHPNGAIYRDRAGCIHVEPEGESLYQTHKESFERGNRIHLELLKKNPSMVGGNVNTFALQGTLYTLLGCSGSIGFEDAMHGRDMTLRRIVERMISLTEALEVFHQAGMLHLDISPDNILVIPQGQREHILLIDYNSAALNEEWRSGTAGYCSIKQGYTAPEICSGEYARVGVHSDLYSVAAVFYACLMGRRLTIEETIRALPPDAAESPYLADTSEPVRFMVKRILRSGLHTLPTRRYADIAAIKTDFQELLDRIDCIGVTHWALFEAARKAVDGFVRSNPTFAFLSRKEALYPLHCRNEQTGTVMNLPDFWQSCAAGEPVLLRASSGQGKTTALLHAALQLNARYSPKKTVAVFLSAYGCRPEEKWFVHDSILRMLKFRKETRSYAAARHELDQLLARPLAGEGQPVLTLLLDGLNEMACDASLLIQELNELSRMPGVSIVLSSRSDVPGMNARPYSLVPLSDEEVAEVLSAHGLLAPEEADVRQLLRTPLMLSMFVRTSQNAGEQIHISTADELIRSMLHLETKRYPEDSDEHWQMDAAIHYVLPSVARQEVVRNRALTNRETLKIIARCYQTLKGRALLRLYPRWIGRGKAILGGAKNAGEWYAIIIREMLWRRAGLLVCDENGAQRVFHQQIREWLLALHQENHKHLTKRRLLLAGAATGAALAVGGLLWQGVWIPCVQPLIEQSMAVFYPKEGAEEIVESALAQCYAGNNVIAMASGFLPYAESQAAEYFDLFWPSTRQSLKAIAQNSGVQYTVQYKAFHAYADNPLMPWSKEDFKYEMFCELAAFPAEIAAQYAETLEILNWLVHDDKWYSRYAEEYLAKCSALVQLDKALLDAYYRELAEPELQGMLAQDSSMHWNLVNLYPYTAETQSEGASSLSLRQKRDLLVSELKNNGAAQRYQQQK